MEKKFYIDCDCGCKVVKFAYDCDFYDQLYVSIYSLHKYKRPFLNKLNLIKKIIKTGEPFEDEFIIKEKDIDLLINGLKSFKKDFKKIKEKAMDEFCDGIE